MAAAAYERVFASAAWAAEKKCLADRATGIFSTVLYSPVYSAAGLLAAYFAWWPIGAVCTLIARVITGWGVFFSFVATVLFLGRMVARAMTFPSSMPMIQRQIEREVAQRTASKLTKAASAIAVTAVSSPHTFAAPDVLSEVTGAAAVLRRMRDNGALSPHAAFVLLYCELLCACVGILAETASPAAAAGRSGAAVIPALLRRSVQGAPADGGIPLVPLPSVLFGAAAISDVAPTAATTLAVLAWLVRACEQGALSVAGVADLAVCICAALSHVAVWGEIVPVSGESVRWAMHRSAL